MDFKGIELEPLDLKEIGRYEKIRSDVAVAVWLVTPYANPIHEQNALRLEPVA